MKWLSAIQFLVAFINAIYFCILYKKAKQVPLPLVLYCVVDALTAPFNIWANFEQSNEAVYDVSDAISWVFSIAEIVLLPTFLSNLIAKKYNPIVPLVFAIVMPPIIKHIFKLHYYDFSFNYLLSGILIAFHSYRYIFYTMSPSFVNDQVQKTNRTLVFGIMICYVSSIPFAIGLTANLLFALLFNLRIYSNWVEDAFLVGNIIQHIFFFIPFRWNLQRQPL